jgi:hypothetical protein
MIAVVEERHTRVGIAPLCDALGLARATFYRRRGASPPEPSALRERRAPRHALAPADREQVLALLHAEVPAGFPGAVRFDLGRPRPLPRLLPLVQR